MIALAGAIGTGLFLGIGKSLVHAGPVLLLLGYIIVSCLVFCVMWSIGWVSTLMPVTGAWVRHAQWLSDDALSMSAGWNVIYSHAISVPNEIVAACTLVEWWTNLSPAIFVTIFGVAIVISNMFLVRLYAETEFWMAVLKVRLPPSHNTPAIPGEPEHLPNIELGEIDADFVPLSPTASPDHRRDHFLSVH